MTSPTDPSASSAPEEAADPAVTFLTALAPTEPMVRRRAFSALLRAVVTEGQTR